MSGGIGQVLPLKKDMSMLAQIGLVGYDQFQVTSNGGTYLIAGIPVPASGVPFYSAHGSVPPEPGELGVDRCIAQHSPNKRCLLFCPRLILLPVPPKDSFPHDCAYYLRGLRARSELSTIRE